MKSNMRLYNIYFFVIGIGEDLGGQGTVSPEICLPPRILIPIFCVIQIVCF